VAVKLLAVTHIDPTALVLADSTSPLSTSQSLCERSRRCVSEDRDGDGFIYINFYKMGQNTNKHIINDLERFFKCTNCV
jgi:hypothetical protein